MVGLPVAVVLENMAAPSTGKKLVNDPQNAVDEALEGIVACNPGLRLLKGHRVVLREDLESIKKAGKVALISGGGSGHEPSHAGYVGKGMLTAAVAGSVFASPPTGSILAAIRAVGKGNRGGVLLIVKNYTGDRLNFGFAAERAKAEGIAVDMVIVGEDCALTSKDKSAGRRGLCGTVLIHKIAGALAEEGKSLEEITVTAKSAVQSMGSMGVSLTPCSIPGFPPSFTLANDEMELGLGIHGEPGVRRMKISNADDVVKTVIDHMTNVDTDAATKLLLKQGDHIALVINNLGGTSNLELNIVARAAIKYLVQSKGVSVDRVLMGSLMTSLEMAGVTLTLLQLNKTREQCLDCDTTAPAWPRVCVSSTTGLTRNDLEPLDQGHVDKGVQQKEPLSDQGRVLFAVLKSIADALISSEAELNRLDNLAGDGDCGSTIKRGAVAILDNLGSPEACGIPCNNTHDALIAVANLVEEGMGGSSGVFYSMFLIAGAALLRKDESAKGWSAALEAGIRVVMKYGGAEPGDRTMLDALHPASQILSQHLDTGSPPLEAFRDAVMAAEAGAQSTATMKARAGRASYVSSVQLSSPDPGAIAVATWLKAAYNAL